MSSAHSITEKSDLDWTPIDVHTVHISDSVGLRIYSDTRPHNWKIAGLQKGLILVYNKAEMVGEGTGFGFPVLVYSDETYFSGTSKVYLCSWKNSWVVRKEFIMNKMARNRFRNVTLQNGTARALFEYLADLYQSHRHFRFLALKDLARKLYVNTAFVKVTSVGKVIVTYALNERRILIKADFTGVNRKKLEKIFMLNEQGSRFFRKYADSQKTQLADEEIGAWDGIKAQWACLTDLQGRCGFRLWRMKDHIFRRGREFLKDSLDWVGLDYEINPQTAVFEYTIEILGV
jgi:hypothetical protein